MARKLLGLLVIFLILLGPGCKVIYKNRVPVTKPKKRYGWFKPEYKKRKRTKTVWMKVHKGKMKKEQNSSQTSSVVVPEGPSGED